MSGYIREWGTGQFAEILISGKCAKHDLFSIAAPLAPENVKLNLFEPNAVETCWSSPRMSWAKVDGYVINYAVNGNQQPPVDLPNNPNEVPCYAIKNLPAGASISVSLLAYADRKLYLEKKFVGLSSRFTQITLPPAEEEEEEGNESGWSDLLSFYAKSQIFCVISIRNAPTLAIPLIDGMHSFNVTLTESSPHSVGLSLEAPAEFNETYSHMLISLKEGPIDSNHSWMQMANLTADARRHRVRGLKASTEYIVHIDGVLREQLGIALLSDFPIRTLEEGMSQQ